MMYNNLDSIETGKLNWTPDRDMKSVLDDININLCSGNFYGILGPNGAGKSSFVRQLLRLNRKSSGEIKFDMGGTKIDVYDINRQNLAGLVSFMPQSSGTSVNFSVFDIVSMGREPYRKNFAPLSNNDRKMIDEALEYTNCAHLRDRNIQLLSGGERQRVMIARTIVQDTPWVILDEPVSNLDVRHQYDLMVLLQRLREERSKTIVAILHDLNLAYSFCNKVVLMRDGKIFDSGDTAGVMTVENLKEVYDMEFEFLERNDGEGKYIAVKSY